MAKKIKKFFINHLLIILFSVAYIATSLLTYKHYGVTYDEKLEYDAGRYLVTYLKTATDPEYIEELLHRTPSNIELRHVPLFSTYSRFYPALLSIFNPHNYFEWYHLLNLMAGLFLFVLSYIFVYIFHRSQKRAIIAPLFLLFSPSISGHIPANPKDIPFATSFLLGTLLLSYFLAHKQNNNVLKILILGLVFGVAQSFRAVGITLFFSYFILGLFRHCKKSQIKEHMLNSILIFIVSLFVWSVLVPFVGINFGANIISLLANSANFKDWDNAIFYNGHFYYKDGRPWHYLFIYSLFQLPLSVLVFMVMGCYLLIKKKIRIDPSHPISVLAFILGINCLMYILLHPVVYNASRHFLFLQTILVILSALFLIEIYNVASPKSRHFLIGATAGYLAFTFVRMVHLHPYEYIYYNELIGGLRGAENKYELDYWGAAYKESSQYVGNIARKNNLQNLRVYACDNQFAVVYYSGFSFSLVSKSKDADIVLCDTFKERLRLFTEGPSYATSLPIVKTIEREGTPIHHIRATENYTKYFR